ncbi:RNA polymerase sigma factor [Spirillospora sp. NPDC048911]|uniref:RNA polymerase sigma factor n=1 Tax=Spirillospora sp. NPDC048911 TaxID=3364527 RepID=UPI003717DC0B
MTSDVRTETDAELIRRSLEDAERFALLYDRHHAAIHRYVARRLGMDLADDLMAETFLIAFRKRDRYDLSRPDALPWLFGIATNLVRKHRRGEVAFWRLIARTGVDPAAEAPVEQVLDRVEAQSARQRLAAALAKLPRGQRDVLLLTAAGGLSPQQIAAALGIATGTAHSRLNRARTKMRRAMSEFDPREESQR